MVVFETIVCYRMVVKFSFGLSLGNDYVGSILQYSMSKQRKNNKNDLKSTLWWFTLKIFFREREKKVRKYYYHMGWLQGLGIFQQIEIFIAL